MCKHVCGKSKFFFNDTATTEIYTLSLHDALPISRSRAKSSAGRSTEWGSSGSWPARTFSMRALSSTVRVMGRSEEHTSELQSRQYLVCRLLLEKKNT